MTGETVRSLLFLFIFVKPWGDFMARYKNRKNNGSIRNGYDHMVEIPHID